MTESIYTESEAKYRSFFENSGDGLLITIADGDILAANPAACAIFQRTEDEICAVGRFGLVDTSDPRLPTLIEERRLTGRGQGEITLVRKDGSKFEAELTSSVYLTPDGQQRTSMIVRDITQRKKSEEILEATSKELQSALNELNKIMDSSLDVICAVSADGNFLKVSAASQTVWGYKPEEMIGKPLIDFVYPDDRERTLNSAGNVMAGKVNTNFENRYVRKDGSVVTIEWSARWDDKHKVRYGVARDITSRKAAQEEIQRLSMEAELEKINRQKQITDAIFGAQERERSEIGRELHDNVNQLLGATRLYLDMAKKNDKIRHEMLQSASTYTMEAIDEIRKLSKSLITPLMKEMGLKDSVKDLADEIMKVHPVKIICTAVHFTDCKWNDKFKLNIFRIIQEQLNNIIKHARSSLVQVVISECEECLCVSVDDNGIGFDITAKKSGVGLTNIKSRCELYNGEMSLTSAPGNGTQLSIKFKAMELMRSNTKEI